MLKTLPLSNLNGGIQVGSAQSPYFATKHTEANTILNAFGGDVTNSQYLGMLKLWHQYNMLSAPLISMTELQNNVLYTNGFGTLLGFSIPYNIGFPFIKENLVGELSKPGLGGMAFPIVLSENCYTNGDILTTDYRNGRQLQVTQDEIVPYGDGWKYMVKLVTFDEDNDFYPAEELLEGKRYMKVTNYSSEFDEGYGNLSNPTRTGLMNYQYQTGNAEQGIEHWITSHGDMLEISDIQSKPNLMYLQHYGDLTNVSSILNFFNKDVNGKPIAGSFAWMPSIIAGLQIELALMKEKALMWGQGAILQGSGRKQFRVPSGYYPQVKNRGNYLTYNSFKNLPNILKNIVGQLFIGRKDVPYSQRRVKFRMGIGAMIEMQKAFMTQFKTDNPFMILGDHPAVKGGLTGTIDKLTYRPARMYSVEYPEVGYVEVEHDPVLDYIDEDNQHRDYEGMYPRSSYMIFVEDLTSGDFSNAMPKSGTYNVQEGFNNGANVMMIKPKNYVDTMSFEVGAGCNPTLKKFIGWNSNAGIISSKKRGFGVSMLTTGELWVKDPSRIVLLEYVPE